MKRELIVCDCCGSEASTVEVLGMSRESKPSVFTATCPPDGINGGQFSMDVCSTCRRKLHDAIQSVIARGRAKHLRTCGTAFRGCDPTCPKEVIEEADRKSYEFRQRFACKVCGNCPDEFGELEHGRGCFVLSSDGGGSEWIDLEEETEKKPLHTCSKCGHIYVWHHVPGIASATCVKCGHDETHAIVAAALKGSEQPCRE